MRKIVLVLFVFTMIASITSHIFQQKWNYYRKAESLFFKEHYEAALFSYLQSLRWGLDEELLASHFIATLTKLGKNHEKLDLFISRLKRDGQKAHLLTKVAVVFLLENMPSDAEKLLKTIPIKKLKSSYVHLLLARALFWQGKPQEAIKEYKKAIEISPQNDPLQHELAKVLFIEKNYEEAYFLYQKLLEKRNTPALSLEVAHLFLVQQKTWAALDIIKQIDEQELDTNTMLFLARIYVGENLLDKAEHAFLLYLEKKPDDLPVRFELAEFYFSHKKHARATEEFRKIVEKTPHDRFLRRALALSLLKEYRMDEAKCELLSSFSEGGQKTFVPLAKRFSDFQARLMLARLFHHQEKNLEKSLTHYLLLVQEEPNNPKIHMEMGEIFQKLCQMEKAAAAFRTAHRLDPKNFRSQIQEAKTYLMMHEDTKVLDLCKTMPKKVFPIQRFLIETAEAFKKEKKAAEALEIYKELVEEVENPRLFEAIADLYMQTAQIKDALFYYQQALKTNPGSKSLKEKIHLAVQQEKKEAIH